MENPIKMDGFGGKTHYVRKQPYLDVKGPILPDCPRSPESPVVDAGAGASSKGNSWKSNDTTKGVW